MILEVDRETLLELVCRQVDNNFLLQADERAEIASHLDAALAACEVNFSQADNKYFFKEVNGKREACFNPYHSVQWMIFLYYLAHTIYVNGPKTRVCDKLYYLNKLLNGLDVFYAVELPAVFGAEHPVGAVLGRASYSDGFFFYQGCTVGGTRDREGALHYPVLGKGVRMFAHSSILGRCRIGDRVQVGAGALVKNQDVPDDSIVFGQSPNLIIKQKKP